METVSGIFDGYIRVSILREGGEKYTNDPADRGGATKWGITEARARAAGYKGDMRDLTFQQAYDIYKLFFWTQPMFDRIAETEPQLAALMLDYGINRGTSVPSKWLQRGLNVLNQGGTQYPDVRVDGVAGAMTRYSLDLYIKQRGARGREILLRAMQALAACDYIDIAEATPSQERFEYGWLDRAFQPFPALPDPPRPGTAVA